MLGLLGPNGAGKTTTMRMVTGFLPPSKGRVSVAGFDLYDHPIQAKQKIGYLPEQPPLYPEMTVRRYLAFVAALKDVPAARTKAAVALAIERARIGDVADTRISTLSKGYRQRVGLAQAIVHEPPVLVLDEPTSSLDPQQRSDVRQLILDLKGRHTIILSTHILPEVSDVADRVVIINRGKVMAVDTPANLAGRLRAGASVRLEIGAGSGRTHGDARARARGAGRAARRARCPRGHRCGRCHHGADRQCGRCRRARGGRRARHGPRMAAARPVGRCALARGGLPRPDAR